MFSKLKEIKKNGFTMLELIFACTIFALLVSGIILAINRSYTFMNNTKVQIRATNLTREGVEMMFNIRDTNRRKYSGEKDKYWLYIGSGNISQDQNFFQKGIYTIKEGKVGGDRFVYAQRLTDLNNETERKEFYEDFDKFFSEADNDYKKSREKSIVTFTGNYRYWSGSIESGDMNMGEIGELLGNGVEFYRIVRVYGIYNKNKVLGGGTPTPEDEASSDERINGTPVEIRFCVKTIYKLGVGNHASELCSIMTNFME